MFAINFYIRGVVHSSPLIITILLKHVVCKRFMRSLYKNLLSDLVLLVFIYEKHSRLVSITIG